MSNIDSKSKVCPSCRLLTPPALQVKRVSRSSGRQTISFRCKACDDRGKKLKGI
jgi:RNase P subunit RPR2